MSYWAMKSEPDVFSFADLQNEEDQTVAWNGVRNYEARNNLQACAPGDKVLFYHSNARPSGVVAIAEVVSEPYPDPTQFEPNHDGFDPESSEEDPTWFLVDIRAREELPRKVPLKEIKRDEALEASVLARRGRLSVAPLTEAEYERIVELAHQDMDG
jgi:predicted RNA-binding protein with PUA-like domain